MRAIGMAEKALRLMCERAQQRVAFGKPLADQGTIQAQIAESRIEIEQARLLTMKAAWLMDTVGTKGARFEISAIKVVAARLATTVIDRAIQTFGAAGVSDDWPLAAMYTHARTLHFVDGPDEVHLQQIARRELRGYEQFRTEVDVKVRIGFGLGTQGWPTAAPRFAELVDALEALAVRLALVLGARHRADPRPDGVARVRGRSHEEAEARHERAGAARAATRCCSPSSGPASTCCRAAARCRRSDSAWSSRTSSRRSASPAKSARRGSTRRCRSCAGSGREDAVDHDGPRFHYEGVSIGTRPVQQPPDVWLGGRRRGSCAGSASSPTAGSPASAPRRRWPRVATTVEAAAAAAGRAIDDEHYGAMVFYARTEVPEPYASMVGARLGFDPGDVIVVGIPALRDRLEEFLAVGFSKLVLVPVQEAESWRGGGRGARRRPPRPPGHATSPEVVHPAVAGRGTLRRQALPDHGVMPWSPTAPTSSPRPANSSASRGSAPSAERQRPGVRRAVGVVQQHRPTVDVAARHVGDDRLGVASRRQSRPQVVHSTVVMPSRRAARSDAYDEMPNGGRNHRGSTPVAAATLSKARRMSSAVRRGVRRSMLPCTSPCTAIS